MNEQEISALLECMKRGYHPPIHVTILDGDNNAGEFTIEGTYTTPEELSKIYSRGLAEAMNKRLPPEVRAKFDGVPEIIDQRIKELIDKIKAGEYPVDAAPTV